MGLRVRSVRETSGPQLPGLPGDVFGSVRRQLEAAVAEAQRPRRPRHRQPRLQRQSDRVQDRQHQRPGRREYDRERQGSFLRYVRTCHFFFHALHKYTKLYSTLSYVTLIDFGRR